MTGAESAARRSGGAHRSGAWWRCRCPLHQSRGTTLALRDGDRGLIVKCFAGCDPRDVLAELRWRGLVTDRTDAAPRLPVSMPRADDRTEAARRIALARRIWDTARDARRSPVTAYLAGRGLAAMRVPPVLRWVPCCRHPTGIYLPAMVARIDGRDGRMIGVHRTYLTRDERGQWRRRDRASLGPISGGAVHLCLAAETLLVGEGLESTLAAMQATDMPGWAALSTSGMMALALPAIVRHVIILADHDCSGAGERAARSAAARWLSEGRRVRIAMPLKPGTDMADVLAGRGYAEVRRVGA